MRQYCTFDDVLAVAQIAQYDHTNQELNTGEIDRIIEEASYIVSVQISGLYSVADLENPINPVPFSIRKITSIKAAIILIDRFYSSLFVNNRSFYNSILTQYRDWSNIIMNGGLEIQQDPFVSSIKSPMVSNQKPASLEDLYNEDNRKI